MRYNKFIIEKYKAIQKPIEINVSKKSLIPIIGINEYGKTTILNAIYSFDYWNDKYNDTTKHLDDVENLYSTKNEPAVITGIIEADFEDVRTVYLEFIEKLKSGKKNFDINKVPLLTEENHNGYITLSRIISSQGTKNYVLDKDSIFNAFPEQNILGETIIKSLPFILYFDDFRDSFPNKVDIDEENIWTDIVEELFNRTDESYSIYNLKDITDERQRKNIISDVQSKLNDTLTKEWVNFKIDNNSKDFFEIRLDFEKIEKKIIKEKPSPTNPSAKIEYEDTEIKDYISFEVIEKDIQGRSRTFYIKDRSKGFYWFFNFVMKLEFNPNIAGADNNSIYLLDEPGSYLHPFAQNKLCKKLIELSNKNIVIYCTHTHYLLDPVYIPINNIHIANKDIESGITLLKYIDYSENDLTNTSLKIAFQPIFDALQINPFSLNFHYKKFLLVEGIYDFYAFNLFNTDNDLCIIPGKGADSPIDNLISLMLGFGHPFYVLWDNDKAGVFSMNKATSFFGEELASKSFRVLPFKKTTILQDLFNGGDIKLIKDELSLNKDINFRKSIAALYFSEDKDRIIEKMSDLTKANFKKVFDLIV